jgi:hypothetical protein
LPAHHYHFVVFTDSGAGIWTGHNGVAWFISASYCLGSQLGRLTQLMVISKTVKNHPKIQYLFIFIFWQYWGLNFWPPSCQAGALPLEAHPQLFFALVIFQVGSCIFTQGWSWRLWKL